MSRLLLVEDDYALAMGTEYTLKAEGYDVKVARCIADARNVIYGGNSDTLPELIILDVMLPDGDGFSFMQEMSEKEIDIPVIFFTAVGDEANIVRGLDMGADDYITKPYRVKELLSRIGAVLRRAERERKKASSVNGAEHSEADEITFGGHRFSDKNLRLYCGDQEVLCTPAELRLLRELLRNYGVVLTRSQLLERVYDTDSSYVDDNTLSVYVKRLRDKLGSDAGYIKTVKGIGYRFDEL